jgi:hypothetical protein
MRPLKLTLAGVFAAIAVAIGTLNTPVAATAAAASSCQVTWGSLAKQSSQASPIPASPLVTVRAGESSCYDRLVFDLDGPAVGYNIRYGQVSTEGHGLPVLLRGGASLNIALFAPTTDINGTPTYNPPDPANLVDVRGFRTFRQVASGGSFEAHSTIGLGVRARLPFRVFVLVGPATHSRVVIDVAHHW